MTPLSRPGPLEDPGAELGDRPAGRPDAASTRSLRPRVTHLVLVDGLPADHWVEDSVDGRWESRDGRRGPRRASEPEAEGDGELRWLDEVAGGRDALLTLHAAPLEVLPLPGGEVPAHLSSRVAAISARCDRHAIDVFGRTEMVAVLRQVLLAVLRADPAALDRSTRDDTATGALVWLAGQVNGLLGPAGAVLAKDLWAQLGVPGSSAGRGAAMLERLRRSAGLPVDEAPAPRGAPALRATGTPGLLLSSVRELLCVRRDAALAEQDRHAQPAQQARDR